MKFKKIGHRMLGIILPIVMLSMVFLMAASYVTSQQIIKAQIRENMNAELNARINDIKLMMEDVSIMADGLSLSVAATRNSASLPEYESLLENIIFKSDIVIGSGIWFEPYAYDAEQKYMGPYAYKDGDKAVVTYDYSNAEYDYFSYDWYKNAMGGSKDPIFSEIYYDETMGIAMSSCTSPIYDETGKFIGAITVDLDLTAIQNIVRDIKVGKDGKAFLLKQDGIYISNEDVSKNMNEKAKITDESNTSLAKLGAKILANPDGLDSYSSKSGKINAYYRSIPQLNWVLVITMPQSELNLPLNNLLIRLLIVSAMGIIISLVGVLSQVAYITKNLRKVSAFAANLSKGDFMTEELNIKSKDEIGQMGQALNAMLRDNRDIIRMIANDSKQLDVSSQDLNDTALNLVTRFHEIESAIKSINSDMMNSSAATEEVMASIEEVNASVNILVQQTLDSKNKADEIKGRALAIEQKSKNSYQDATRLSGIHEENIRQSIKDAEIVSNIGVMAEVISNIAEEINLLSLNASIEAARAGEQGRGFAVVAGEIGKLAGQTAETVSRIKETIQQVGQAFGNLMNHSQELLGFINDKVTPDYSGFVEASVKYGEDAESIDKLANQISEMSYNVEMTISEVSQAIQSIAEASQNTSMSSSIILNTTEEVSHNVDAIGELSKEQKSISKGLDDVVNKFNI